MTRTPRDETRALPMREQLLASAREVFLSEGYAAASLAEIAARAGDSKGAVRTYFANKEAMFLELLSIMLDAEINDLQKLADEAKTAEQLISGVRAHLEGRDDVLDFSLVAIEFFGQMADDTPSAHACINLYRRQRRVLAELLRALPQWSRHDPDLADDVAAGLVAMTLGLAVQRGLDPKSISARMWARAVAAYLAALIGGK